ncbi:DUF3907 family protein [Paenibacillus sp. y28]|uniref:DUF3907 family protein n=1 Tax=Paenibacillus sp. y28 TaxID=3129110 RepID=UPI003018CC07
MAVDVKSLCESTKAKLKEAINAMEQFLNTQSLAGLNTDNDPEMDEFYKGYLADTRHLLVFSEVCYEKLGVCLRRPSFHAEQAERALYETYHNSINSYFYPQHECYSEDGRYAYTGHDAIRFRKKPSRAVRDLTIGLSPIFESLREELAYYENDYINQKRIHGERV